MSRVFVRASPPRIGCVLIGPVAVALGLAACALGYFALGAMLARPISVAEATDALHLYESYRLSWDAQAELRARGLARPGAELLHVPAWDGADWPPPGRRHPGHPRDVGRRRLAPSIAVLGAVAPHALRHAHGGRASRADWHAGARRALLPHGLRPARVPRIVWETGAWGYRVPL